LITLYDTACGSENIGDEIIMDAVIYQLNIMFPAEIKVRFPTHYPLSLDAKKLAWDNRLAFVGGTNLLRNYWRNRARKNQWAVPMIDAWKMMPAVLMGVGWNTYALTPKLYAKIFYNRALSKDWLHSVRDSYTVEKLKQCGITNVINTGCPTLWGLSQDLLSSIPNKKSSKVVFTITDYRRDESKDLLLFNYLLNNYEEVYFWPQGSGDLDYFRTLSSGRPDKAERVSILGMDLQSFNNTLLRQDIDYIGTRLHAGVRALQHKQRAMIISVDNRAEEMGKDFNLPVIARDQIASSLDRLADFNFSDIRLPNENIANWKRQFLEE
jgi:polysaccharide pyruvyl transferase WcaK-like protein